MRYNGITVRYRYIAVRYHYSALRYKQFIGTKKCFRPWRMNFSSLSDQLSPRAGKPLGIHTNQYHWMLLCVWLRCSYFKSCKMLALARMVKL